MVTSSSPPLSPNFFYDTCTTVSLAALLRVFTSIIAFVAHKISSAPSPSNSSCRLSDCSAALPDLCSQRCQSAPKHLCCGSSLLTKVCSITPRTHQSQIPVMKLMLMMSCLCEWNSTRPWRLLACCLFVWSEWISTRPWRMLACCLFVRPCWPVCPLEASRHDTVAATSTSMNVSSWLSHALDLLPP